MACHLLPAIWLQPQFFAPTQRNGRLNNRIIKSPQLLDDSHSHCYLRLTILMLVQDKVHALSCLRFFLVDVAKKNIDEGLSKTRKYKLQIFSYNYTESGINFVLCSN